MPGGIAHGSKANTRMPSRTAWARASLRMARPGRRNSSRGPSSISHAAASRTPLLLVVVALMRSISVGKQRALWAVGATTVPLLAAAVSESNSAMAKPRPTGKAPTPSANSMHAQRYNGDHTTASARCFLRLRVVYSGCNDGDPGDLMTSRTDTDPSESRDARIMSRTETDSSGP